MSGRVSGNENNDAILRDAPKLTVKVDYVMLQKKVQIHLKGDRFIERVVFVVVDVRD